MRGFKSRTCLIAVCLFIFLPGIASVHAAVDVPDSLKDVPLFAGSRIQQSMDSENSAMVMAVVKAKADAVFDFFKNTMKGKGWKIVFQAQSDDARMVHFQKDKKIVHVNIQGGDDEEEVTYTLVSSSQ